MFAIRITVSNPKGKLKSLEEFQIFDNSEHMEAWEEYGHMILKHLDDRIILDAKRESFNADTQTYTLIFYSETLENAKQFLDDYNNASFYSDSIKNLENKGWITEEKIEEASQLVALGAPTISMEWHQHAYKVEELSNSKP